MSDLVVHHLDHSRSTRILWLLEELGVSYEMKTYKRGRDMLAPASLREVHPLGKAPVVTVGGRTYAESGAIIEAMLDRYDAEGELRPAAGTQALDAYRYWLHFAEGSLLSPLLVRLILDKLRSSPMPFFVKPIARGIADKVDESYTTPNLERLFAFIEDTIADAPYFAGEAFTAADIQMGYPVEVGLPRARLSGRHPATEAWLARIQERPGYRKAVEVGGQMAPSRD